MTTPIDTRTVGPLTIETYILPELCSPCEQFMNEDLNDILDGIESGKLQWFAAKVAAYWEDLELAADFLGGCCYTSHGEFLHPGGYHDDMVDAVTHHGMKRLETLAATLETAA